MKRNQPHLGFQDLAVVFSSTHLWLHPLQGGLRPGKIDGRSAWALRSPGTQRETAVFWGGKETGDTVFICVYWVHSEKEIHVSAPQPSKTPYPKPHKPLFIGQPLLNTAHVRRQQFPSHCIKSSSNGA